MDTKKATVKKVATKEIPTGVKVISIWYYIGAGLFTLFGLLFIAGAGFLKRVPVLSAKGPGLFIFIGVILIGLTYWPWRA